MRQPALKARDDAGFVSGRDFNRAVSQGSEMLRLDYLSCLLTIVSTVLVGRKRWQGWIIAGANSVILCVIGMRTAQFGFVPANLFCIGLYANNLWSWRPKANTRTANSLPHR